MLWQQPLKLQMYVTFDKVILILEIAHKKIIICTWAQRSVYLDLHTKQWSDKTGHSSLILTRDCVKRHGSSQDEEQGNHKDKTRHAVTRKRMPNWAGRWKSKSYTAWTHLFKNTHIQMTHVYTDNVCVCESTGVDLKRDTPN